MPLFPNVLYVFFALFEDWHTEGRADVVAVHPCGVYIFELKVDDTAEAALTQVMEKHYERPYLAGDRSIWLVGISFDGSTRQMQNLKATAIQNHCVEH